MKIFSWVHRQFLHKAVKKDDDYDKVALLENDGFVGSCDGWNDGILAIGTFGVDLYQRSKEDETLMCNQVMFLDDDGDQDEGMECPLVRKGSKHDHVEKQNLSACDEVAKLDNHDQDDHVNAVKDSTKVRKSGERITLADLLRADPGNDLSENDELSDDRKINAGNSNSSSNSNNNTSSEYIKSFLVSKAKKKLGEDGSIKKTKQLMRKILRKKIHPDIGIQKESPSRISNVLAIS